jgi:nucleotide-binding universal stress UspA family protein
MFIVILLFVAGIALGVSAVLIWEHRVRARTAGSHNGLPAWQAIAVPIVNRTLPAEALLVAARLARAFDARVILIAILQVPRTMSLNAGTAPGMEAALDQLEAAERIVRSLGAQAQSEVIRVREMGEFVERAFAEVGAQIVVLESHPKSRATSDLVRTFTDERGLSPTFDVILTHSAKS